MAIRRFEMVKSLALMLCASVGLGLGGQQSVSAQPYPNKPLRIIVPFTPGATNDIVARLLGQKLSESMGQPVIVENRTGAGGNIGTDFVAKAPPDGYTLLLSANTITVNAAMREKLPFDVMRDLRPVILVGTQPMILVAGPDFGADNIKGFIGMAKARPGQLSWGTPGNGTPHHLVSKMFESITGTELIHVPFKGAAPALTETMTGRISVTWATLASAGQLISSKKVKVLGVTSPKRISALPEVPTLIESGVTGFNVGFWYGILTPGGTPDDIITRLHTELARILKLPDVAEKLVSMSIEISGESPAQFSERIQSDLERWGKIVRDANIKSD